MNLAFLKILLLPKYPATSISKIGFYVMTSDEFVESLAGNVMSVRPCLFYTERNHE